MASLRHNKFKYISFNVKPITVTSHERHGVSNQRWHECLLNSRFQVTANSTSKIHISGSLWGNRRSPVDSPHKGPVVQKAFTCHDAMMTSLYTHYLPHDDVIKWKHFTRYWPFVRGVHRSPVVSPHRGQRRGALMFLWSQPEQTVGQTREKLVILDANGLTMTSL